MFICTELCCGDFCKTGGADEISTGNLPGNGRGVTRKLFHVQTPY